MGAAARGREALDETGSASAGSACPWVPCRSRRCWPLAPARTSAGSTRCSRRAAAGLTEPCSFPSGGAGGRWPRRTWRRRGTGAGGARLNAGRRRGARVREEAGICRRPRSRALAGVPSRRARTMPARAGARPGHQHLAPERVGSRLGPARGLAYAQLPGGALSRPPGRGPPAVRLPMARVPAFAPAWSAGPTACSRARPGDRRLRVAVCALSDLAWRADTRRARRGRASAACPVPFIGLDHAERVLIAARSTPLCRQARRCLADAGDRAPAAQRPASGADPGRAILRATASPRRARDLDDARLRIPPTRCSSRSAARARAGQRSRGRPPDLLGSDRRPAHRGGRNA